MKNKESIFYLILKFIKEFTIKINNKIKEINS